MKLGVFSCWPSFLAVLRGCMTTSRKINSTELHATVSTATFVVFHELVISDIQQELDVSNKPSACHQSQLCICLLSFFCPSSVSSRNCNNIPASYGRDGFCMTQTVQSSFTEMIQLSSESRKVRHYSTKHWDDSVTMSFPYIA